MKLQSGAATLQINLIVIRERPFMVKTLDITLDIHLQKIFVRQAKN